MDCSSSVRLLIQIVCSKGYVQRREKQPDPRINTAMLVLSVHWQAHDQGLTGLGEVEQMGDTSVGIDWRLWFGYPPRAS